MSFQKYCINPTIIDIMESVYVPLSSNRGEKLLNCIQILLHKRHKLGPYPRNWRITVYWNIVLTIFYNDQMYRGLLKIVGTAFKCIIDLQLREDWPKMHGTRIWEYSLEYKIQYRTVSRVQSLAPNTVQLKYSQQHHQHIFVVTPDLCVSFVHVWENQPICLSDKTDITC